MKKRVRKNAHESRSFEERSWRRDDGYVQKKKKNESKGANTQRGQCQGREEVPKAFSRRDNFHQTRGVGSWVTNLPKEIIRDRVGLGRPLSSKMQ